MEKDYWIVGGNFHLVYLFTNFSLVCKQLLDLFHAYATVIPNVCEHIWDKIRKTSIILNQSGTTLSTNIQVYIPDTKPSLVFF